jgi:hypothetical protein
MQRTESTLAHYFSTITFNHAAHPDNRMNVMSAVFRFSNRAAALAAGGGKQTRSTPELAPLQPVAGSSPGMHCGNEDQRCIESEMANGK